MTKLNNKAAILYKINKPLEIKKINIPKLSKNLLLIKIKSTFICGSQINEWLGYRGKDKYLPHTLGHEASGEILMGGNNTSEFKKGDKVLISWIKKQKKITHKTIQYSLKNNRKINSGSVSTFLKYAVISKDRVYKLKKKQFHELTPLFGCAMPTGVGLAIKIKDNFNKNDLIVIYGVGGVGIICLSALVYFGFKKIIVIDKDKNKLNLSRNIGAYDALLFKQLEGKINNEKIKLEDIKACVECSGDINLMNFAIKNLAAKGTCIIAGNAKFGAQIKINPYDIILGKKIIGSVGGDLNIEKNLNLFNNIILKTKPLANELKSKSFDLEQINTAMKLFKFGKIIRPLIIM